MLRRTCLTCHFLHCTIANVHPHYVDLIVSVLLSFIFYEMQNSSQFRLKPSILSLRTVYNRVIYFFILNQSTIILCHVVYRKKNLYLALTFTLIMYLAKLTPVHLLMLSPHL